MSKINPMHHLSKEQLLVNQREEFLKLFSLTNLHKAYQKAKKKKKLKPEVYDFSQDIVGNLLKIQEDILNGSYQFGPYRSFIKYDSKRRYIVASPFKDRIVHWVIYDYLYMLYDKSFIYDSFGNRKGKGSVKGMKRAKTFLNSKSTNIILKIDLSKYFYSVHHSVLKREIKRRVKNKFMLELIYSLIDSYVTPQGLFDHIFSSNSVYFKSDNKGMPIGSLDSQIFANIYVSPIDYFVKNTLKVKKYIRYVDDMVFFLESKTNAHYILKEITKFCEENLLIEINPKKVNFISKKYNIDFLGYRIYRHKILPRKTTQKKIRKSIDICDYTSLESYNGILIHTDSHLKNICTTLICG